MSKKNSLNVGYMLLLVILLTGCCKQLSEKNITNVKTYHVITGQESINVYGSRRDYSKYNLNNNQLNKHLIAGNSPANTTMFEFSNRFVVGDTICYDLYDENYMGLMYKISGKTPSYIYNNLYKYTICVLNRNVCGCNNVSASDYCYTFYEAVDEYNVGDKIGIYKYTNIEQKTDSKSDIQF